MLLAASGLLIRTLIHLETLPPGFNPNGVMIAKASLDDARYPRSGSLPKVARTKARPPCGRFPACRMPPSD